MESRNVANMPAQTVFKSGFAKEVARAIGTSAPDSLICDPDRRDFLLSIPDPYVKIKIS
jgi:hypothetical protein